MSMFLGIITIALLVLAWFLIIFGMAAIFKLDNLYSRIISATTIDSVASITVILAMTVLQIYNYEYVLRFALLIGFLLITNPISSHVNIRSAYLTGYKLETLNKQTPENPEEEGYHG